MYWPIIGYSNYMTSFFIGTLPPIFLALELPLNEGVTEPQEDYKELTDIITCGLPVKEVSWFLFLINVKKSKSLKLQIINLELIKNIHVSHHIIGSFPRVLK